MPRIAIFLTVILSLSAFAGPGKGVPAGPDAKASKYVDGLQKQWDSFQTYQADFRQVIFAKRLGTRDESKGTVTVWKPNRLRWKSDTDGTLQILNGKTLTAVTENPRRKTTEVDIYADAAKAVDTKILKFLAGQAKFKALYHYSLAGETDEAATIKFRPKGEDTETLVAEIDKNSYLLRSLTTETVDNRVRIEFSGIRTNVKLDPKLFKYEPRKTDVVRRQ